MARKVSYRRVSAWSAAILLALVSFAVARVGLRPVQIGGRVMPPMAEVGVIKTAWNYNWWLLTDDGRLVNAGAPPGKHRVVGSRGRYSLRYGINGDPVLDNTIGYVVIVRVFGGWAYYDGKARISIPTGDRRTTYQMPAIVMRRKSN